MLSDTHLLILGDIKKKLCITVSCRDVGVDCDFRGTGETEEELMNNLVDHAIKDHGYTREYVMKPEMQEKIKSKIKKS